MTFNGPVLVVDMNGNGLRLLTHEHVESQAETETDCLSGSWMALVEAMPPAQDRTGRLRHRP